MTQEEYNARYKALRRERKKAKQREYIRNYMTTHREKYKDYWKRWAAEHPGYFSAEARRERRRKRQENE